MYSQPIYKFLTAKYLPSGSLIECRFALLSIQLLRHTVLELRTSTDHEWVFSSVGRSTCQAKFQPERKYLNNISTTPENISIQNKSSLAIHVSQEKYLNPKNWIST